MILLFGGELPDDGTILQDAFHHALSTKIITSAWKKVGINPFTCVALKSKNICHELTQTEDLNANREAYPKSAYLKTLHQDLNMTSCQILDAFGYHNEDKLSEEC